MATALSTPRVNGSRKRRNGTTTPYLVVVGCWGVGTTMRNGEPCAVPVDLTGGKILERFATIEAAERSVAEINKVLDRMKEGVCALVVVDDGDFPLDAE